MAFDVQSSSSWDSGSGIRLPKVSIGMPVHNGQEFIRQALDSLLTQTFTDFELIVSDNASTDATPAICQQFADQDHRIRCMRNELLMPAPDNFNRVLQVARGTYFMWTAADDVWDPLYIETLVQTLEGDPACIGAAGRVVYIDNSSQPVRELVSNRALECPNIFDRLRAMALFQPGINFCLYGLYRTPVIQRIGVKSYRLLPFHHRSMEFPTLFALATTGIIRTNDNACLHYRFHINQEGHKHEQIPIALALEVRLLLSVVPWVLKGRRSLMAALFALSIACFSRGRMTFSMGIQKLKHLLFRSVSQSIRD